MQVCRPTAREEISATFKEPAGDESKYEYADSDRIANSPSSEWRHNGVFMGRRRKSPGNDGPPREQGQPNLRRKRTASFDPPTPKAAPRRIGMTKRAGRLVSSTPTARKSTIRYDAVGNLLEADDGRFPVRFTYDAEGRLSLIDYPEIRRRLKYEYDPMGRIAKFTDSENREARPHPEGELPADLRRRLNRPRKRLSSPRRQSLRPEHRQTFSRSRPLRFPFSPPCRRRPRTSSLIPDQASCGRKSLRP